MNQTIRIPKDDMYSEFLRILLANNFEENRAQMCAKIFMESSLDGIYSHGVNRFPRFIKYIKQGLIDVKANPTPVSQNKAMEQWSGNLGPGPLNALFCAGQVMKLATQYSIGSLALANTNHWMRGGTYGWHAAKKGFVYIAWTNTIGNMPAWGARDQRLGNNPLIIAVPYKNEAIVLDLAMSQFSYGKMEDYRLNQNNLPVAGGFDSEGNLTTDPNLILESERVLPIGYWKGAGLSLLLDILATILSGGLATHEISRQKSEHNVSQVFIAIDIKQLKNYPLIAESIENIIRDYVGSFQAKEDTKIVYPGQRVLQTRRQNSEKGILVNAKLWEEICSLNSAD